MSACAFLPDDGGDGRGPARSMRPADDREALRQVLGDLLAAVDPVGAAVQADTLAGEFGSMAALAAASSARLTRLVGRPAATLLAAHRQAALFALHEEAVRGPILATRYELLEYLHHASAGQRVESLRVFFLDRRRELLADEVVARGGAAGIVLEPRWVVARALELGAAGLVLVHNHPGGTATPSPEDRAFTRRLVAAAALLDIRVHDHLVVARDGISRVPPSCPAQGGVIDP